MADKAVVDQIEKLKSTRAERFDSQQDYAGGLAGLLDWLADDYTKERDLYLSARLKTGRTMAESAGATALQLRSLVKALRALDRPVVVPAPIIPTVNPDALDALIADSVAENRGGLKPETDLTDSERALAANPELVEQIERAITEPNSRGHRTGLPIKRVTLAEAGEALKEGMRAAFGAPAEPIVDVAAYIRGDTDTLPARSAPEFNLGPVDRDPSEPNLNDLVARPATRLPADTPIDPAIAAASQILAPHTPNGGGMYHGITIADAPIIKPHSASFDPGGRKLSFADLLRPPPLVPPMHLSWSQIETLGDCALRYRLTRLEPDVRQRPSWATVGGNAFHNFVEGFERDRLVADHMPVGTNWIATDWDGYLQAETLAVSTRTGVSPDDFRPANRGKENGDWWCVEGEDMAKRYVDQRMETPDRELARNIDGRPMIEQAFAVPMPWAGTEIQGFVDQVWITPDAVVIDDLKTGARAVPSTRQLGVYAHGLMAVAPDLLWGRKAIQGRFYDARKGTYTPPVNLLEKHPMEALAYDVQQATTMKQTGAYPARRSEMCNGCPVLHACPVGQS